MATTVEKDPKDAKIKRLQGDLRAAEELIAKLEYKLSPNHSPAFTERLRKLLDPAKLEQFKDTYGGEVYYVGTVSDLYFALFGHRPHIREVTEFSRSLKSLWWEETRATGVTSFRIKEEELNEIRKA
jgi:hypothetical protein